MNELVRGNILQLMAITLKASGLATDQYLAVEGVIKRATGKDSSQINPNEFYPCQVLADIVTELRKYRGVIALRGLMRLAGSKVYPDYVIPAMRAEARLAGDVINPTSPLKLLKFEAEGFLQFHRGVTPRRFVEERERRVVIDAKSPHDRIFMEGIYEGICNMTIGKNKALVNSTEDYIFTITW